LILTVAFSASMFSLVTFILQKFTIDLKNRLRVRQLADCQSGFSV
jgi:hypothetical protein